MNKDRTDRTIIFHIRTTAVGAKAIFATLAKWLNFSDQSHRRINWFIQRIDGVPMETDNDHEEKFSS